MRKRDRSRWRGPSLSFRKEEGRADGGAEGWRGDLIGRRTPSRRIFFSPQYESLCAHPQLDSDATLTRTSHLHAYAFRAATPAPDTNAPTVVATRFRTAGRCRIVLPHLVFHSKASATLAVAATAIVSGGSARTGCFGGGASACAGAGTGGQHPAARESTICLPKMQKRWTDAGGATLAQTPAPPRVDKGKGTARAQPEEAMDLDAAAIDTAECVPSPPPRLSLAPRPPPPPPRFRSPLAPPPAGLSAGPSPSTSFARLSRMLPHPGAGGPSPAWFSVGAGANVEVLEHGGDAGAMHRKEEPAASESRNQPAQKAVSAAGEVLPSADTVASTSTLAGAQTLPPADVYPSSRVRFVEPVTGMHMSNLSRMTASMTTRCFWPSARRSRTDPRLRAPALRRSRRRSLMSSATSHRVVSPTRRLCPCASRPTCQQD
ncbi:hypothetical protein B0H10DRAFT_1369857 [Mycena sp. CBHHK59/15]|nr:hypothetical protein B0H10DRAFT_1369857 [Mycena sp. CBHHK59/15]